MAGEKGILSRRTARKKGVASAQARQRPATTSGPRLGTYRLKHSEQRQPTLGRKRGMLPGKARAVEPESIQNPAKQDFLVFCVRQILTSGGLVLREGPYWSLREDVGGVSKGEVFISLDSCARAVAAALQYQYFGEREVAA